MKFVEAQMFYFSVRAVVRGLHAIALAVQDNGKASNEAMDVAFAHLRFVDDCVQSIGAEEMESGGSDGSWY